MFYCEECRERNDWPESSVRSTGPCGNCGEYRLCHDGRDRRREKTMELMEWTEDKPGEDGFYWVFAETWGMGIKPVLVEVKDGLYKPLQSPHWRKIDNIIERYKFAGPMQPPEILKYHPERRRSERVVIGGA